MAIDVQAPKLQSSVTECVKAVLEHMYLVIVINPGVRSLRAVKLPLGGGDRGHTDS